MRALLFVGVVLCSGPSAAGLSVECPRVYPPEDASLTVVPPGHRGKGRVAPRELENVAIFGGAFGGNVEFVSGRLKKVKGGTDMVHFSPPTWLVCHYGGGISWWEQVNVGDLMAQGRIRQSCIIQIRDHGKRIRLVCQ